MSYQTNYMGFMPAEVRYNRSLSADAKLLYCEITAGLNADGLCRIKAADLEEMYGVSRATINRWLAELEESKMIFFEGSARDPRGRAIRIKKETSEKIAKVRKRSAKQDNLIKNEQVEPSLRKNEQVDDYLLKNEQVEPLLNQICASTPYSITSINPCVPFDAHIDDFEVGTEEDPVGTSSPKFKRPTLKEVLTYAEMNMISAKTAEAFFWKMDGVGWMNGQTPIRKWQSMLNVWKLNERQQQHAGAFGAKPEQPAQPVSYSRLSDEERVKIQQARERHRQLNADKFKGMEVNS